MISPQIKEAIFYLEELKDDADASKKLKQKTQDVITILKNQQDLSVEKALIELEEISSSDLTSYHRTKVWDVISVLESVK
jgi:uncharacterized protein (UPF0147 family)